MSTRATTGVECAIHFEDLPRCLLDRSPQPQIALSGPSHVIQYVNPAFSRLAGARATELIGRPFDQAVPEGEANRCMELLDRVYRTGAAETLIEQPHDGRYWSYIAWAILSPTDAPIGVMVQVTDATDAAQFRRDVTSMNEALLVSAARQHELTESAETFNAQLRDLNRLLEQRTAEVEHKAQELRRLNTMLAQTEQRERKHLAEVLHDGMQQVLVAAKMRLESLRSASILKLERPRQRSTSSLTKCIETSRTLAIELFPPPRCTMAD